MQAYIDKAAVLIEALPYIQKFKGEKVVIKCGGSVMEEELYCRNVLKDIVFMRTVGMEPILVHGGGKAITKALNEENITTTFHHGLRVTTDKTIDIVSDVLINQVGEHLIEIIQSFGAAALRLNGLNGGVLKCIKKTSHMGSSVDLGFVGDIVGINKDPIFDACKQGIVPVIAPIGVDESGQVYNINADIAAGEIAASIQARKIVYLSDIPGILKDVNDPKSIFSSLKVSQVESLIDQGIIQGGMIPKIQSGLKTLEAGSRKTHIIDGRLQHSLLLEIFTDKGVGTEIVHG